MTASGPLPSGGDSVADAVEWKSFVEELKRQWKLMWTERIDDKVRAEGIADKDFELLFVNRGTVIAATRCYRSLDFREILEAYEAPYDVKVKQEVPSVHVGGWRKFGRAVAASQTGSRRRRRAWQAADGAAAGKPRAQPLKKGGRGWLHARV